VGKICDARGRWRVARRARARVEGDDGDARHREGCWTTCAEDAETRESRVDVDDRSRRDRVDGDDGDARERDGRGGIDARGAGALRGGKRWARRESMVDRGGGGDSLAIAQ